MSASRGHDRRRPRRRRRPRSRPRCQRVASPPVSLASPSPPCLRHGPWPGCSCRAMLIGPAALTNVSLGDREPTEARASPQLGSARATLLPHSSSTPSQPCPNLLVPLASLALPPLARATAPRAPDTIAPPPSDQRTWPEDGDPRKLRACRQGRATAWTVRAVE